MNESGEREGGARELGGNIWVEIMPIQYSCMEFFKNKNKFSKSEKRESIISNKHEKALMNPLLLMLILKIPSGQTNKTQLALGLSGNRDYTVRDWVGANLGANQASHERG